jgi:hypothetical protein
MNGLLLRTEVDRVTGQLSDTRTRFLGTRAPKLFAVSVRGRRSMLALSSRPWLVRALTRLSLCQQCHSWQQLHDCTARAPCQ